MSFKVYRIRHLQLLLYGLGSFVNGMVWITFAAITDETALHFDITRQEVHLLSVAFMAAYVPGSVLASYLLGALGLRKTILVAAFADALGTWCRFLATRFGSALGESSVAAAASVAASLSSGDISSPPSATSSYSLSSPSSYFFSGANSGLEQLGSSDFSLATATSAAYFHRATALFLLFTGQIICAIAQPIFTNSEAKIGAVWFAPDERGMATTVGSMINILGSAFGNFWPSLLVHRDSDGVHGLSTLLFGQALLASIIAASLYFLFLDGPPTPPSASQMLAHSPRSQQLHQQQLHNHHQRSMIRDVRDCFKNYHFVILCVCFGAGMGIFTAMNTLIQQLIAPAGYDSNDAGFFGSCTLLFGVISSFFVAIFLDRTHMYNPMVRFGNFLGLVSFVFLAHVLRPKQFRLVAFAFSLVGSIMTPLIPVTFESGAECTYPISEEISTGLLMSAGQLFGIAFTLIIGNELETYDILGKSSSRGYSFSIFEASPPGLDFMMLVMCFCTFLAYHYQGRYHRLEADGGHAIFSV